jgi:hypothetical protein
MNKIDFKVTFLSDIVLQASSNTEGSVAVLDFIPGSNFLGMVARKYTSFSNPFDIFHSGKVRFGDATLLHDDKTTYKIPFSYFKPKLGGKVKNHHHIEKFTDDEQLKQIRDGYITKDGQVVELNYNYSQKSAYDTKERKSKDGQMYGYKAIKQGSTWKFSLHYHDSIDSEQIITNLIGKKQLGKSKSAQYGSVMIEKIDVSQEEIEDLNSLENVVLYANSRWALFDENGMPTYQVTPQNLGLSDECTILWDKSQIRTTSFSPYNGARKTKDYTRVVIEKGSVIVLDKVSKEDIEVLKSGIGAFLSEGFGEVLINPVFTKELHPTYEKETLHKVENKSTKSDKNLVTFLSNRRSEQEAIFSVSTEVQEFIKKHQSKFKEVSKSQWGQIRSICNQSDTTDENIQTKVQEYIDHGVAKKKWEKGEKIFLEAIENNLKFTQLLATLMPKQKGDKDD